MEPRKALDEYLESLDLEIMGLSRESLRGQLNYIHTQGAVSIAAAQAQVEDAKTRLVQQLNKLEPCQNVSIQWDGQAVESASLIGDGKDNDEVVVALGVLASNVKNKDGAGILNNLGCARAWLREVPEALEAFKQAKTQTNSPQDQLTTATSNLQALGQVVSQLTALEAAEAVAEDARRAERR